MKKTTVMLALSLGLAGMAPNAAGAMSSMCKTEWTKELAQALTADQVEQQSACFTSVVTANLTATQIVKLTGPGMEYLSADATKGWTSALLKKMTADQLKGLIESNELTTTQLSVAQTRYTKLTGTKTSPSTTVKKTTPTTAVKKTPPTTAVKKTPPTTAVKKTPPTTAVKKTPTTTVVKGTPPTTAVKKTPPTTAVKTTPSTTAKTPPTTAVNTPPTTAVKKTPPTTAVAAPTPTTPTTAVKTPPTTAVKRTPPTTAVKTTTTTTVAS